ncbi:serine/threonine protein kinase [Myxococcota bacterium]|nr:serine/threonine protein kinase [Myxococcota bacterium]
MPRDDEHSLLSLPGAEDPDPSSSSEDGPADTFAFFDRGELPAPGPLTDTQLSDPLPAGATDGAEAPVEIPGYRILGRISRGGMGEVLLAERVSDAGVSVRCAIKVVHPGRRDDPMYSHQILAEARIVADLRHQNIVSIMDVGRRGDQVWLAMEWVDGCDIRMLRRLAREQGADLPLRHVVYIAREALQGLHHAHGARGPDGRLLGLVHRDISPGNVLVSRQGAVKLADFGVAALTARGGPVRLAGKPQYLAPELYRGSPASVQSDVYAMGVTLFELLTMRPLVPRNLSFAETERFVLDLDPKALLGGDLTLPDGLDQVLLRALAPRPQDRYAAALEMLEDINDFAYEAGLRLLDAHFARYVSRCLDGPEGAR